MFDRIGRQRPAADTAGQDARIDALQTQVDAYEKTFTALEAMLVDVSEGDLTSRIVNWDEFGEMSGVAIAFNRFVDLVDAYVREAGQSLEAASKEEYHRKFLVHGMAGDFARGAVGINSISKVMETRRSNAKARREKIANSFEQQVMETISSISSASAQTNASASTLIEQAEETRTLSSAVVAASDHVTLNVQSVASAAEEMAVSVQEIAGQVSMSSEKTNDALTGAGDASGRMNKLSESSKTIGQVVNLISDIAAQTNLLALNATIEAARAGDAGRGFAVVASEVKSLAQQTAKATDDIGKQVSEILSRTEQSVSAVGDITTSINALGEVSVAIAASTEEQTATMSEISASMQEAFRGTQDVSSNIHQVNETVLGTFNQAEELKKSASEMAKQTELLRERSAEFLEMVRAT
ncbi:MAG: hypothetical protein JKY34_06930 [Kordiimonadaceae bacterium]|nr:hypothetical protein [Kordiimonadaceae bacterium]